MKAVGAGEAQGSMTPSARRSRMSRAKRRHTRGRIFGQRAKGGKAMALFAVGTLPVASFGEEVTAKQQAVYSMHYDITLPVDTVFNTIEDLADLADHAVSPMTAQQQIDLACREKSRIWEQTLTIVAVSRTRESEALSL